MPEINSSSSQYSALALDPTAASLAVNSASKDRYAMKLEFDAAELGFPDPRKRPSELRLNDTKIEMQMLKQMGLDVSSPEKLALVKKRLNADDPFKAMQSDGTGLATYNADTQKYEMRLSISSSLYAKLKGWTKTVNQEIAAAKEQTPTGTTAQPSQTTGANGVEGIADPNAPKTKTFLVMLPNREKTGGENLADRALLGYVQQTYGGDKSNLYGPNITNIRNGAKSAGVKLLSITDPIPEGGAKQWVTIKMTVADVQKIKNLYIKEQAQVNKEIEIYKNAADKTVAVSFMRGFFKGAWEDLKNNGETVYEIGKAVADPVDTARKIGKAIAEIPKFGAELAKNLGAAASEFARMTPVQMEAFAKELISKGVKDLENLEGSALFEKLGEITGTVAMEVILMKGVAAGTSLAYNAFKATSAGTKFIEAAETVGQTVKSRVANFISDEAAAAAEKRFFERAKEIGLSPNSVTNVAVDPELWKAITQIAANKLQNAAIYGGMKFEQFAKEMIGKFGETVKPQLEKLYRDEMISLNLRFNEKDIAGIKDVWRAQELNKKIGVPRADEIRDTGWSNRVEFRQKMNQAQMADYDKHVKAGNDTDAKKISEAGDKPPAQFLPGLKGEISSMQRRAIQMAYENGQFTKVEGKYLFFYKFDKPIGYNLGNETDWMRIELTDHPGKSATIHGFPTNLDDVRKHISDIKQ